MNTVDFTAIFKKYKKQWIALRDDNQVICAGRTLDAVMKKAKRKGYDKPVTMKVPDSRFEFVLYAYLL